MHGPMNVKLILNIFTQENNNFFSPNALRPNQGHDLLILEVSRSHTGTRHSR